MKDIKSVLATLLPQETDWKRSLLSNWDTVIGNLKTKVRLEKVYDDTLVLAVADSCWLQELYLLSPMLIKTINAHLDEPRIKQLRFKKAGISTKTFTPQPTTQQKQYRPVTLTSQEQAALVAIKDPQLRSALEQFLVRCYQENE